MYMGTEGSIPFDGIHCEVVFLGRWHTSAFICFELAGSAGEFEAGCMSFGNHGCRDQVVARVEDFNFAQAAATQRDPCKKMRLVLKLL